VLLGDEDPVCSFDTGTAQTRAQRVCGAVAAALVLAGDDVPAGDPMSEPPPRPTPAAGVPFAPGSLLSVRRDDDGFAVLRVEEATGDGVAVTVFAASFTQRPRQFDPAGFRPHHLHEAVGGPFVVPVDELGTWDPVALPHDA
jgi:hypothetical protein